MSLRFIYATDLHGDTLKFRVLQRYALKLDVPLIHLGSDLLPKGPDILKRQKTFVNTFLKKFYEDCKDFDITCLAFFGNDDVYTRKDYFRKYASLLDETPYIINGYTFRAYGYVPDYQFGLKTACKRDSDGWVCPEVYIGTPIDANEDGFYDIDDVEKYFDSKGSIEQDLRLIKGGSTLIMSIHCPPSGMELDVCPLVDDKGVKKGIHACGSDAVRRWIEREQPLLVLSGHIHESFKMTGKWKEKLGKTIVIQPGQEDNKAVFVAIEINGNEIHAERFNVCL